MAGKFLPLPLLQLLKILLETRTETPIIPKPSFS